MAKKNTPSMNSGLLRQIQIFNRNRLAAGVGSVVGASLPVISYSLAHGEAQANPYMWVAVAGGLTVSSLSIFDYARMWYGSRGWKSMGFFKAVGFTILLEVAMTFAKGNIRFLPLILLCAANAVAMAYALTVGKKVK